MTRRSRSSISSHPGFAVLRPRSIDQEGAPDEDRTLGLGVWEEVLPIKREDNWFPEDTLFRMEGEYLVLVGCHGIIVLSRRGDR